MSERNDGFTLVELVIVIGLMALIAGALSASMILMLRTEEGQTTRLDESQAPQGLATYFPADAQSTTTYATATGDPTGCAGSPAVSAGNRNVVALSWAEQVYAGASAGTTAGPTGSVGYRVAYRYEQAGLTWQLVRYSCTTTDPTPTRLVVADDLSPTVAPTITTAPEAAMTVTMATGYRFTVTAARVNSAVTLPVVTTAPPATAAPPTSTTSTTAPPPSSTTTSTTAPPPSSTTTSTSAPAACTVTGVTFIPSPIDLLGNGNVKSSVSVTVTSSAACPGSLTVRFTDSPVRTVTVSGSGTTRTGTIPAGTPWAKTPNPNNFQVLDATTVLFTGTVGVK